MAEPQRPAREAADPARPGKRAKRTPQQGALGVLRWIGIALLALAVIGAGVFGVVYATTPIPDPNKDFQTNVSTVFYRDGKEQMGTFAVQNRVSIPYSEMPENVKQAIVAGENESFWTDPGISVPGLMRAVATALGPGNTVGGSTITQQYVKVLYLTQEKTLTRKLTEIVIALKVGQEVSKEDILEGYLNTVYYGRGAYGIQAAAKVYFDKDAKDLDDQQAIALSAIINSPGNLDPARGDKHRADLLERYQYIINQMVKLGYMTEQEKAQIYTTLPEFPPIQRDSRFGGPKGFLLMMVQDELKAAGFTEDQISGGGLRITTTVDAQMQDAAIEAAQAQAERIAKAQRQDPGFYHPAIASVDTTNGAILALYGGPDFTADFRNWGTTPRPTGSTFKPWALVAGLRDGATLNDRFNGNEFTPKGASQPISNAGGRNYGPVTLETATTNSINSAYVDLVQQMKDGPAKVAKAAADVGITNPPSGDALQLSIPLGYSEVSPVDAARGLATLVNGGKRSNAHIVAEVKDIKGAVVWKPQIVQEQTVEPDVAQNAVAALTGVVEDGTARSVRALGYEVAGKTGTYYISALRETRATWFIGSTQQISTAFALSAGPQGTSNLGANTYGSTYAAQGWLQYMRVAMKGQEKLRFPGPTKMRSSGQFSTPPRPATSAPAPTPTPTPSAETSAPIPDPVEESPEPSVAPTPTQAPPTTSATPTPTATSPGGKPTGGQGPNPPGKNP